MDGSLSFIHDSILRVVRFLSIWLHIACMDRNSDQFVSRYAPMWRSNINVGHLRRYRIAGLKSHCRTDSAYRVDQSSRILSGNSGYLLLARTYREGVGYAWES